MFRSIFSRISRTALLALAAAGLFFVPALTACAAKDVPTHVERGGGLPASGRVVVRSGLAWMNEQSPLFVSLKSSLIPLLQRRGLTVVEAPPSTLLPMPGPRDPGPAAEAQVGAPARPSAAAGEQAAADAAARTSPGKPLRLPAYTVPSSDAKLPASVLSVVPVDPMEILFARSQADGMPLLRRGGRIPGRVPAEMTGVDPGLADYTLVVRVTMVRPQSARLGGGSVALGSGGSAGVGGVSTLGYGAAAPSAPPRPVYGGTPQDYARGYEGAAPNDPWHRETDMLARDYMTKYGPQPQYATPPGVPGQGGVARSGGGGADRDVSGDPIFLSALAGGVTGFALEMECYDLRKISGRERPAPIWRAVVQRRADQAGLPAALPGMLEKALDEK